VWENPTITKRKGRTAAVPFKFHLIDISLWVFIAGVKLHPRKKTNGGCREERSFVNEMEENPD